MKVIAVTTVNGKTSGICEFASKKEAVAEIVNVWGWKKSTGIADVFYGCLAGVIGYQNATCRLISAKDWNAGLKYAY